MKNKIKFKVIWDGYHWWAKCKEFNITTSGDTIGDALIGLSYWLKEKCEITDDKEIIKK